MNPVDCPECGAELEHYLSLVDNARRLSMAGLYLERDDLINEAMASFHKEHDGK